MDDSNIQERPDAIEDQLGQALANFADFLIDFGGVVAFQLNRINARLPALPSVGPQLRRFYYGRILRNENSSLIRSLAAILPFDTNPREYTQQLVAKPDESLCETAMEAVTLNDVALVETEKRRQGVCLRCDHYGLPRSPSIPIEFQRRCVSDELYARGSAAIFDENDDFFRPSASSTFCAEPHHSASSANGNRHNTNACGYLSASALAANSEADRIATLEAELAQLKAQMTAIIMAREGVAVAASEPLQKRCRTSGSTSNRPATEQSLVCDSGLASDEDRNGSDSTSSTKSSPIAVRKEIVASSSVGLIPKGCIPPPPPLPPPLPSKSLAPAASTAVKRKLKTELTLPLASSAGSSKNECKLGSSDAKSTAMFLCANDLNQSRLRKVDRSPGGTPIKRHLNLPPPTATGDFIAMALKRKFASILAEENSPSRSSEDEEKENNRFAADSDDELFREDLDVGAARLKSNKVPPKVRPKKVVTARRSLLATPVESSISEEQKATMQHGE